MLGRARTPNPRRGISWPDRSLAVELRVNFSVILRSMNVNCDVVVEE